MSAHVINEEGVQYGITVTLETIVCYKCSIPFAVPSQYKKHLQSSQENFYCPSGHQQHYTKSTETILKERLEVQKAAHENEIARLKNNIQWANDRTNRVVKERTALKGKITKIKNRIKNGVCPCCNRTFANLHQHMKNQHPEFNNQ